MIIVAASKQPPAARLGFEEDSRPRRICGTVRDTVLYYMYIHARAKRRSSLLPCNPVDDFFDRKIRRFGVLAMKECRCNPDLIGDSKSNVGNCTHDLKQ